MGITLLGDDIYSSQPFCEDALAGGYHFIFTCKSSSHKYLSEWIETADVGEDIQQLIKFELAVPYPAYKLPEVCKHQAH